MRQKRKKIIAGILIAVMAGLVIFSGIKLLQYFEEKTQTEEQFTSLSRLADTDRNSVEEETQVKGSRLKGYRKLYEIKSCSSPV